ncbi:MAG: type II toxin-antitoxin system HicB family antitoxin [Methanophagales archaeon]|nr:type II toxin-antitoxin system HicB family antitoxin [Methanophagales archaeon]
MRFTIMIERNEEGSYTVTVPSLPGCITEGDTWEEAIALHMSPEASRLRR